MNNKLSEYSKLLTLSYDEAVSYLLGKYGVSQHEFYRETSYHRYLNGEIKSIAKGKYTRTAEGLYCHHIFENKYHNLGSEDWILKYKYPYYLQKKENLVYCDLVEHLILHALITNETEGEYGFAGYNVYLEPLFKDWFIHQSPPESMKWMMKCYKRAFLTKQEADKLVAEIHKRFPDSIKAFYFEDSKKKSEMKQRALAFKKEQELRLQQYKIELENEQRLKNEQFEKQFPKFKEYGISSDANRQKIIKLLFDFKYHSEYKTKKEFESAAKCRYKDDLVNELYELISNQLKS